MLCAIPQPSNDAFQDLGCTMSRGRGWCRHAGRCTQWNSKATIVRKPLMMNLFDFPALSRFSHKASTSKTSASLDQRSTLDKSKHSATVMQENENPNIVAGSFFPPDVNADSYNVPPLGDPPDPSFRLDTDARDQLPPAPLFHGSVDAGIVKVLDYGDSREVAWYDTVLVDILITHFQFLHFRITNKAVGSSLLATAVYASPSGSKRKLLWPHLYRLATSIRSPWLLFGDFNATLVAADKSGCAQSSIPSRGFQNLLFDYGLRDMGYQGPAYTWSRGSAYVRLDRFIYNSYYDKTYPESIVHHLLRMRSDHRPILLTIGRPSCNHRPSPFRYFSAWQSHADFSRMVADNWVVKSSMSVTLQSFVKAADTWNKTIFGYVGTKKRMLMARLRGIQKSLCCHPSRFLRRLESELLVDLEHLLDQEELLWRQKSRSDWISLGDRNTRYFHRRALCRKQRNKITALKISDGSWCDNDDTLMSEAVGFFKTLFEDNGSPEDVFLIRNSFPQLSSDALCCLDSVPSRDEIHGALMEMAPLKSPGWDGFDVNALVLADAMAKFDSANGLSLFAVPPSPLQPFLDSAVSTLMY
ncbi:hypothetical protein V6N13_030652 [Hibiscus sabdariffa]